MWLVLADVLFLTSAFYTNGQTTGLGTRYAREMSDLAKRLCDKILSPSVSMPDRRRSMALSVIIRAVKLQALTTSSEVVHCIPTIALLARVGDGPHRDWESTETVLEDYFKTSVVGLQPLHNFDTIVEVLENENWGPDGAPLRVCITLLLKI